jgi:hypothetical protein
VVRRGGKRLGPIADEVLFHPRQHQQQVEVSEADVPFHASPRRQQQLLQEVQVEEVQVAERMTIAVADQQAASERERERGSEEAEEYINTQSTCEGAGNDLRFCLMQYPDEIMVVEDEVGLRNEDEDVLRSDGQASLTVNVCSEASILTSSVAFNVCSRRAEA